MIYVCFSGWLKALGLFNVLIQVYDYFLTLDREIEHVWKSRWSPVKHLFLFNRYFVIVDIIVQQFCMLILLLLLPLLHIFKVCHFAEIGISARYRKW